MSAARTCSVIVPTYNRAALLVGTVATFQQQRYPSDLLEIIVADNNSQDDTRARVEAMAAESPVPVRYVFEPRQGVHYARNTAAKAAQGSVLYFTDDDMEADPSLLAELLKVFDLDAKIAGVTGTILPRFCQPPPRWVERTMINGLLSLTEADKGEALVISNEPFGYSCHQGILRDAFMQAGGFNPENTAGVWIGDGETGLNLKLHALGYRFAFTAASVIHHVIPPERTTLAYLVRRLGNQGFCDAYSDYRRHRRPFGVLRGMVERNLLGVPKTFARSLVRLTQGRDSWRNLPALAVYFGRRNQYDLRLLTDRRFRDVVEIDDWLSEDNVGAAWLAEVLGGHGSRASAKEDG
jgi:glycosyltransferase involved in cell wall biosynthesis